MFEKNCCSVALSNNLIALSVPTFNENRAIFSKKPKDKDNGHLLGAQSTKKGGHERNLHFEARKVLQNNLIYSMELKVNFSEKVCKFCKLWILFIFKVVMKFIALFAKVSLWGIQS